mmetsp:Transcript_14452/g.36528  ORF Transcript_14452/g.36528 Transcript_14452/m.36528 type:complete len:316 (+) Transcript_14452:269-1216(+)
MVLPQESLHARCGEVSKQKLHPVVASRKRITNRISAVHDATNLQSVCHITATQNPVLSFPHRRGPICLCLENLSHPPSSTHVLTISLPLEPAACWLVIVNDRWNPRGRCGDSGGLVGGRGIGVPANRCVASGWPANLAEGVDTCPPAGDSGGSSLINALDNWLVKRSAARHELPVSLGCQNFPLAILRKLSKLKEEATSAGESNANISSRDTIRARNNSVAKTPPNSSSKRRKASCSSPSLKGLSSFIKMLCAFLKVAQRNMRAMSSGDAVGKARPKKSSKQSSRAVSWKYVDNFTLVAVFWNSMLGPSSVRAHT